NSVGEKEMASYFCCPVPRSKRKTIHVVSEKAQIDIDFRNRTKDQVDVYVGTNEIARLDSALRLKRMPSRLPDGRLLTGTLLKYSLVLDDSRNVVADQGLGKGLWKIRAYPDGVYVTIDSAIKFLE